MHANDLKRIAFALPVTLSCCSLYAAESEQEKIAAAKKEGAVYWYGSRTGDGASALVAGINQKYSFIDIKRSRAANAPILSRLDVEARARGLNVDGIDLDRLYLAHAAKRKHWTRP